MMILLMAWNLLALKGLVKNVVCRAHEGHLDLERFHHVADEEVPALHVLHAIVRVVAMWRTNYAVLRAGRGRRRGVL